MFTTVHCTEAGNEGLKWLTVLKLRIQISIILVELGTCSGTYRKTCSRNEQEDRQCTYNVALRPFRVSTAAGENEYILHTLSVHL